MEKGELKQQSGERRTETTEWRKEDWNNRIEKGGMKQQNGERRTETTEWRKED